MTSSKYFSQFFLEFTTTYCCIHKISEPMEVYHPFLENRTFIAYLDDQIEGFTKGEVDQFDFRDARNNYRVGKNEAATAKEETVPSWYSTFLITHDHLIFPLNLPNYCFADQYQHLVYLQVSLISPYFRFPLRIHLRTKAGMSRSKYINKWKGRCSSSIVT